MLLGISATGKASTRDTCPVLLGGLCSGRGRGWQVQVVVDGRGWRLVRRHKGNTQIYYYRVLCGLCIYIYMSVWFMYICIYLRTIYTCMYADSMTSSIHDVRRAREHDSTDLYRFVSYQELLGS